jgi:hypothetical protein
MLVIDPDPYYIRPPKKQLKYWKEHYKTKTSQEYYNEISESIKETLINLSYMYEPITEEIMKSMEKTLYISTFHDGAICKNLRVWYNIDKSAVQIDWKFNGSSYEVLV